jgi:hypothetical protein
LIYLYVILAFAAQAAALMALRGLSRRRELRAVRQWRRTRPPRFYRR